MKVLETKLSTSEWQYKWIHTEIPPIKFQITLRTVRVHDTGFRKAQRQGRFIKRLGTPLLWSSSMRIQGGRCKRPRLYPGLGRSPGERNGNPLTPVFLPGQSHGERRLAGYSPRGRKESDWAIEHTQSLSGFIINFLPALIFSFSSISISLSPMLFFPFFPILACLYFNVLELNITTQLNNKRERTYSSWHQSCTLASWWLKSWLF